jgi:hypothetical protein
VALCSAQRLLPPRLRALSPGERPGKRPAGRLGGGCKEAGTGRHRCLDVVARGVVYDVCLSRTYFVGDMGRILDFSGPETIDLGQASVVAFGVGASGRP